MDPWHFAAMTDLPNDLPLASEFPPASREDWLKLVRTALKDRPFERLIAKTYDGLPIEPLYARAADARPIAARRGPWQVMARVDHPDPGEANKQALDDLANGATGLLLVFGDSIGSYGYGLPADAESIARALDGVHLDAIAIEIETGEKTKGAADEVAALVQRRGLDPRVVNIRFGHDPIGVHASIGAMPLSWSELGPRFAGHALGLAGAGFAGPLTVADGRLIHNAGGSEAQELAYVIASGVAYLRALEAAAQPLEAVRRMVSFRLTADTDLFLTIAKLRALRKLWARVEAACGLTPQPAHVTAETAWRTMTRRDPHVNMLRATIAAFGAVVGSADAVAVLPFTAALGLPDRFARRIARNTQLLLLEESNLAKVGDPAAGSGGIEDLTDKLCRTAWSLFQEFETGGGIVEAIVRGDLQTKIAAVRAEHEAAVAQRKDVLTGTSEYPDLKEVAPTVLPVKPAPPPPALGRISYAPIVAMRLGEPFEQLRDASDRILAATGARPKVFLANLGTLAEFGPRATFAKNFFEAGGIEAVTSDGYADREAMVAAFKTSGARLACLCGTDERYAAEAAIAAKALAAAGARHLYLAGRPKQQDTLKAAGVATFVYVGCDALACLREAYARIAS